MMMTMLCRSDAKNSRRATSYTVYRKHCTVRIPCVYPKLYAHTETNITCTTNCRHTEYAFYTQYTRLQTYARLYVEYICTIIYQNKKNENWKYKIQLKLLRRCYARPVCNNTLYQHTTRFILHTRTHTHTSANISKRKKSQTFSKIAIHVYR